MFFSYVHSSTRGSLDAVSSYAGDVAFPVVRPSFFTNLSGEKESEYFSDGLSEEILNALSQVDGLKVAARSSSFFFKGKDCELAEVAAPADRDDDSTRRHCRLVALMQEQVASPSFDPFDPRRCHFDSRRTLDSQASAWTPCWTRLNTARTSFFCAGRMDWYSFA